MLDGSVNPQEGFPQQLHQQNPSIMDKNLIALSFCISETIARISTGVFILLILLK